MTSLTRRPQAAGRVAAPDRPTTPIRATHAAQRAFWRGYVKVGRRWEPVCQGYDRDKLMVYLATLYPKQRTRVAPAEDQS